LRAVQNGDKHLVMSLEPDSADGTDDSQSAGSASVDDPLAKPLGNWADDNDHDAESGASAPAESAEPPPAAGAAVASPAYQATYPAQTARRVESPNMLPAREVRRSGFERLVVRLIATCGVVGIGVAIAAIMVSSKSQGWLIGLVVSIVSVALSAVLWSSRQL
jgi:hypothetical protein